ncbi:FMN-binding protein [Streptomyces sp. NBC_01267]|uniref:FMN-binding protein n=1 Tax=unclassified Streptomyces TaxID=2593676 RepID=UPI00225C20E5|nr:MULTISPECIES: FMN-binding protein [unclassified Streptomyces]MCX4547367.1 FMN-binding protein [Streptomyces sp. NBC_01500]WSC19091.1 FMN-binding protein [Streptomyces sp. NBC_01766]WSV53115.1 FMN-binding protein [Streptomyces sp. NBC_01014]
MRRAIAAAASTGALIVVLLAVKPHHSAEPIAVPPPTGTVPAPTQTVSPGTGTSAARTYTGTPADTKYGPVQVSATVKAGKLTDIKVLHMPSEDSRSREISAGAVPKLTKEALTAHSAHIQSVSGASYTSQGYMQSLQSALDQAHG